jgi:cytochrome c peroxidase
VYSPVRVGHGMTAEARLGQLLFFDRELSGNRNIACATCHLPEEHAADDRNIAVGQGGAPLFRNTIEPFNRAFADSLFWDGRVELIDGVVHTPVPVPAEADTLLVAQALLPMLDRDEMRGRPGDIAVDGRANELALIDDADVEAIWAAVLARLLDLPGYITAFFEAYPSVAIEELSIVHVARAIVAFEQHLWELTDTPFDRYLGTTGVAGDDVALQGPAYEGAELFFGDAGCSRCHGGPLLSDGGYHNIAVPQIGPGADGTGLDLGRAVVTGRVRDRFAFRTPPLRNVALTAPYMHDGAFFDLASTVRHHLDPAGSLAAYDGAFLPAELAAQVHHEHDSERLAAIDPDLRPLRVLSDRDVDNLVAFLDTLSSSVELGVFPGAGVPPEVPSGLPIDGHGSRF